MYHLSKFKITPAQLMPNEWQALIWLTIMIGMASYILSYNVLQLLVQVKAI